MVKTNIPRDIKILSFSFFLIFFGYNGIQQYITTFFSEQGFRNTGFYSLILIYTSFSLFSLVAVSLSLRYRLKRIIALSSLAYVLFIFSILAPHVYILYILSIILGASAALLWTSQTAFLIRKVDKEYYGRNSGFFVSIQRLGSFLGVVAFSFFLSQLSFRLSIISYALFPFLGFLLLLLLNEPERQVSYFNFQIISFLGKIRKAKILPRLSLVYFSSNFILGLVIGIVPFQIKSILSSYWIGIITSIFYIIPFSLSFPVGWLSDIIGRKNVIILGYIFLIFGLLFLYFGNTPFPILAGITLLSFTAPFIRPASISLVGDIGSERNFEIISGFFLGVGSIGTVFSLLLGLFLRKELVYIVSIIVAVLVLYAIIPVLNLNRKKLIKIVIYETEDREE